MFVLTLKEKIVVISEGETFYGKILVASDINRVGDDHHQVNVVGFISIANDIVKYNSFRNDKKEIANILESNIMSVQIETDITRVPT